MNKTLKKVLIISASVLMFLSAGAGINNVNAKKYHYRYRTHRIVRHHNKRTRHNKKRAKRIKKAKVSLKNKYGYYKRGIYLDTTAKERSRELVNKFSHENSNSQYASDEDGNIDSENIAFETEPSSANNDDIAVEVANDLNKMLFYDEEPSDGGHYEDIKDHDQVGVGATIANDNVYLAEDFAE